MNQKDLSDIGSLIDQKLDEKLEPIHRKLDEHTVKIDSLTRDMIDVQKKTDILPDLYSLIKGTKEIVDDHEQRIQNLETAA